MTIKYYFEYECNKRHQKPENGVIEFDDREYRTIKAACETRGITIKDLIERAIQTLTAEQAEQIISRWNIQE